MRVHADIILQREKQVDDRGKGLNAHERQAFVRDGHLVHQGAVSGEILADLLELAEECQRYNDPFYSERTAD